MAKQVGRVSSFFVYDSAGACQSLTGDINSLSLSQSAEAPDVTGLGETTRQRLQDGLKDYTVTFNGWYDAAAAKVETVLNNLISASTHIVWGPSGSTSGCVKYSGCVIMSEYAHDTSVDGALAVSATFVARTGSLTRGSFA